MYIFNPTACRSLDRKQQLLRNIPYRWWEFHWISTPWPIFTNVSCLHSRFRCWKIYFSFIYSFMMYYYRDGTNGHLHVIKCDEKEPTVHIHINMSFIILFGCFSVCLHLHPYPNVGIHFKIDLDETHWAMAVSPHQYPHICICIVCPYLYLHGCRRHSDKMKGSKLSAVSITEKVIELLLYDHYHQDYSVFNSNSYH